MFNIVSDTLVRPSEKHYHDLITLERDNFKEKVWLNLEIIGEGTLAESIKRIIQISFEDIFFDAENKDIYERFEETLKEINLLLKNLKEKNEEGGFCVINAIIAVQDNHNLHLTQSGDGETYLIRNGKLTVISEGLSVRKTEDSDIFMNIASGEISVNDTLVLTSKRLLRFLTAQQIAGAFRKNIPEALAEINHTTQDADALAVTALIFKRSVFADVNLPPEAKQEILRNEPLQKVKAYFDSFISWIAKRTGQSRQKMENYSILGGVAIVLLILVIGVSVLFSNNQNSEKRAEYNLVITNATEELKKVERLSLTNDKETANAVLNKMEQEVLEVFNEGLFREESSKILDEAKKLRDQINNIQRISNPKILADVASKREGISLLGMEELEGKLFAFDYNALYETILDQVEAPLKISDSEQVFTAKSMPDEDIIIFLTESGKVVEYEEGQFSLAETGDDMWKKAISLAVYRKYLYLLSPEENQIWKYERRKSSYTSAKQYNLDADLAHALDIAIDGDIYVLSKGGEIIKIYRGNRQEFNIVGAEPTDLENVEQIFTLPDQNYIYLLDSLKNSILIVAKDGKYKRQIILEGIGQRHITDIYIEQDEQKLYAVDQEKIYEVGL